MAEQGREPLLCAFPKDDLAVEFEPGVGFKACRPCSFHTEVQNPYTAPARKQRLKSYRLRETGRAWDKTRRGLNRPGQAICRAVRSTAPGGREQL